MIADLLPTRLYWVGLRGVARMNGREVRLTAPPAIGLELDAIDYAAGADGRVVAIVMPRRAGWRDMRSDEIAAALRLLEDLTRKDAP